MQSSNYDFDSLLNYQNTVFHENHYFADTTGYIDDAGFNQT